MHFPHVGALLNRDNANPGSYVFDLQGADNVTLDNLHMTGANVGVLAAESAHSDGVTISNNTIFDMESSGISIAALNSNTHVEFNRVSDSSTGIIATSSDAVVDSNEAFLNQIGYLLTGGAQATSNVAHDNSTGFSVNRRCTAGRPKRSV